MHVAVMAFTEIPVDAEDEMQRLEESEGVGHMTADSWFSQMDDFSITQTKNQTTLDFQ